MSQPSPFRLIIEDDEGRRNVVPISLGEVSIGRLESNQVRLDERNVSRRHARLVRENGSVYAEDLESYNGVWVNGDRIQGRHEIREGDLIRIGDFHLELRGEGLQQRAEETTQRTLLPRTEQTNPEIRVGGEANATPPVAAVPAPAAAGREAARAHGEPVPAPAPEAEATAIIRMDAPELRLPRGQGTAVAGQKAKLLCVSTSLAGRELEITKSEVVIGRTSDNDIAIDHRSVSRHHAKIAISGRRYLLQDLKSANGTLINGEAYAQTELKRGDLIELGHVKLRFVPPSETYTLSAEELAAVRSPSSQSEEKHRSGAERHQSVTWLAAGGVALVSLLVLIVFLRARSGEQKPTTVLPANGAATPGVQSTSLLGRANVELAQRRWEQALSLANAVLSAEPNNAAARDLAGKAQLERQAQATHDKATKAVEAGDWPAAWKALESLPPGSIYADQSRGLVERVRAALVAEILAKARAALEAQDFESVLKRADEIAMIDGNRSEPAQLRQEVERARAAQKRAAAGAVKSAPHAMGAAHAPNRPAAAAAGAPPMSADAKAIYNEAVAKLKAGELNASIETLNRCVQVDPVFAQCYRALGIAHAKAGNGPTAAKFYRKYLKVDPSAPDADKVRQLLEQYEAVAP